MLDSHDRRSEYQFDFHRRCLQYPLSPMTNSTKNARNFLIKKAKEKTFYACNRDVTQILTFYLLSSFPSRFVETSIALGKGDPSIDVLSSLIPFLKSGGNNRLMQSPAYPSKGLYKLLQVPSTLL